MLIRIGTVYFQSRYNPGYLNKYESKLYRRKKKCGYKITESDSRNLKIGNVLELKIFNKSKFYYEGAEHLIIKKYIPIPVFMYRKKWNISNTKGLVYRANIYYKTELMYEFFKIDFVTKIIGKFFTLNGCCTWASTKFEKEYHIGKYYTEEDEINDTKRIFNKGGK